MLDITEPNSKKRREHVASVSNFLFHSSMASQDDVKPNAIKRKDDKNVEPLGTEIQNVYRSDYSYLLVKKIFSVRSGR